jgi:hypothetical protein
VLGSATAIFLAIYIGLRNTLLIGGVLYIGAALIIAATKAASSTAEQRNNGL